MARSGKQCEIKHYIGLGRKGLQGAIARSGVNRSAIAGIVIF
jgi:hypothetical protein